MHSFDYRFARKLACGLVRGAGSALPRPRAQCAPCVALHVRCARAGRGSAHGGGAL